MDPPPRTRTGVEDDAVTTSGIEEARDASRRTRLANERTLLAWWRTGLAAFAVSLGAGRLVPALTKEPRWPYVVIGVGFGLLGLALFGYGLSRQRTVDRAIARGEYLPPDQRLLGVLTGLGVVLGIALIAIVVAG
jgi:putative membrane protein